MRKLSRRELARMVAALGTKKDNIFPIAASVESFNRVREIYSVFGAADRVEQEVFPGEHSFWGKRGVPFLARHLAA
jgi:hypothetical protein